MLTNEQHTRTYVPLSGLFYALIVVLGFIGPILFSLSACAIINASLDILTKQAKANDHRERNQNKKM